MIYIAIAQQHATGGIVDELLQGHDIPVDTLATEDQAEAADWAQARALQTRTDYQVFRLVETLYYKGKR